MKHLIYIHERLDWTQWQGSDKKLLPLVSRIRILQGRLLGQLLTLGFDLNVEAQLDAVTLEIVKTSEIESEAWNNEQVRSFVTRHLGIETLRMASPTREIDTVVEMMFTATYYYQKPLVLEDLLVWHRALPIADRLPIEIDQFFYLPSLVMSYLCNVLSIITD